ncbi:5688_t:CDS:1, partial [Acaulospora morrowiae]
TALHNCSAALHNINVESQNGHIKDSAFALYNLNGKSQNDHIKDLALYHMMLTLNLKIIM